MTRPPLTAKELAELRKAAEAATCCDQESNYRYLMDRTSLPSSLGKLIDLARPLTVLALLDELAAVKGERDQLLAKQEGMSVGD